MNEPVSKCSWASCQRPATRGSLCEGHALKPDPILVQAEMKDNDVKPPTFAPNREIQLPEYKQVQCVACSHYHGSVQGELACLRSKLLYVRGELISARTERDRLREIVSKYEFEPKLTNPKGKADGGKESVAAVEEAALLPTGEAQHLRGEAPPSG